MCINLLNTYDKPISSFFFSFYFGDEEQIDNLPKSKRLKKGDIRISTTVFW